MADAYQFVQQQFTDYGLGTLAPLILQYAQQGYDNDTISLLLQQSPEYKQRFAANDARLKAGLPVLSPAEYLATEKSYRDILSAAGMPAGFYDSPADFTQWIAEDKSPQEIQGRVQEAAQYVNDTDPNVLQAWQTYYGVGKSDLVAYALDSKRGLPLLQKQAAAVDIGSAANRQGLSLSKDRAELFADQGVTAAQAQQGYSQIGQILPDAQRLGQVYGKTYTQTDAENEVLGGLASAQRKRQQLVGAEESNFSGNGGAGKSSFGKSTAGSF